MIVVSVLEREFGALRAQASAQAPFADAIELRLDHVGDPGVDALGDLLRAISIPTIVAVNGPDAHGHFRGDRDERFATLASAVRAGAAFIDVDWKDARLQGPLPATCRRIVSRHEMEMPPDLEQAWSELEAASRTNDRLKLVVHARNAEDGVRMLESTARRTRDVVGFASGEHGSFTRVLAPVFGSAWTYAAPAHVADAPQGHASAPGQLRVDELRAFWPQSGVTRDTRIFAVLGKPVTHSLSPPMHGTELRALGLDAVYVAIEPDDLALFLLACTSPLWRGFSVTSPFKTSAFALASGRDAASSAARASNTLVRANDGTWSAHNTDVPAIADVVKRALDRVGKKVSGSRIVVIGTGGAVRAAVVALREAKITIAGRNAEHGSELAREMEVAACSLEQIADIAWDVVVHCTPLGSLARPGEIAVDARALRKGTVVVDAIYRPARTPILIAAERAGAIAVPGSEWFVRQAALQFELFTEHVADEARMRATLERALSEDAPA